MLRSLLFQPSIPFSRSIPLLITRGIPLHTSVPPNMAITDDDTHDPLGQPLALPASTSDSTTQVSVGGDSVKLMDMGPVVVNADGTISRIDNWHELSDIERQNVNRILLKRNAQRLAQLKEKEAAAGGGVGGGGNEV
ncbi:hypothetical protein BC938DRAFT_482117 [Jimgerdemannia flammicorona]|uniref:Uncharacterized protein n=1 Tax=Jimgerdemannia flammicorona TaxID=994334 RepID=A0A433QEK1_9FUNG|nr:hypothetical protein BC938DRAFT_482117 [Jimgerdemannia flammicorona]